MTTPPTTTPRSLLKGLAAGLIGGLAGAAAMSLTEKFYPAQDSLHHGNPLNHDTHWTFGPLMGAAYGALAELAPAVTDRRGVTFGVALCSLTVEGVLPGSSLSAVETQLPLKEQSGELITFSVYGLVTEAVRKRVRQML